MDSHGMEHINADVMETECVICYISGTKIELQYLDCGHAHCLDCIEKAVNLAIKEEGSYPPKCCNKIEDHTIEAILSVDPEDRPLLERFREAIEEYSVKAPFRTRCASEACIKFQGHSRYLHAERLGQGTRVACPDCSEVTCRLCKKLVVQGEDHVCETDEEDKKMLEYKKSLLEEEQWLLQKCPTCGCWVQKSEACNHMTCMCGGQFCLVCGKLWDGLASCRNGCPHFERPVYDDQGYNQYGYRPDTGRNRAGDLWDPNFDHEHGDNDQEDPEEELVFDDEGYDQHGYDRQGFDREGYDDRGLNAEGYDRNGFDEWGRTADGYDRAGFHWNGYDRAGYDRDGLNRAGRDRDGYFDDGHDFNGFDRSGLSFQGLPFERYNEQGFDASGLDVYGYDAAGLDAQGYDGDGFGTDGYNRDGFDRYGFDRAGYDAHGFDKFGRDVQGYSLLGFNAHHLDRNNSIEPGYYKAVDGAVRRIVYEPEGPSADVMDCDHFFHFQRGGGTCFVCHWSADVFHHRCGGCDAAICRRCASGGNKHIGEEIRRQYPWPGSDSFGVDLMFERVESAVADGGEKQSMKNQQGGAIEAEV